jgi:acyl carrier protein
MEKTVNETAAEKAPAKAAKPAGDGAGGADQEAAFEKFRACAVEVLGVPAEEVTPEASFEDLQADSLDLVELVMALEEAFEITVDESELDGVTTVQQAFSLVTSKI